MRNNLLTRSVSVAQVVAELVQEGLSVSYRGVVPQNCRPESRKLHHDAYTGIAHDSRLLRNHVGALGHALLHTAIFSTYLKAKDTLRSHQLSLSPGEGGGSRRGDLGSRHSSHHQRKNREGDVQHAYQTQRGNTIP